jgi:hypothetical protein
MSEQTETVSVKLLKQNNGQTEGLPKNPRFIKNDKFKQLVKSIQDFPEMLSLRPIVVNEDMVLLGGNMRLKACIAAGLKEVPIIKAIGWSIEQQKEFLIKDNLSFGAWDLDEFFNKDWDKDLITSWGFDEFLKEQVDMTQEEMGSLYNNENCVYPLIPRYDEKYNAVVIVCTNDTELATVRTILNIPPKSEGYKSKFLGQTYVVHAKDLK